LLPDCRSEARDCVRERVKRWKFTESVANPASGHILGAMQKFVDTVAQELEKPRPLLKQVVDHAASRHEVSRDDIGSFLERAVKELEEYELDLLFSAQFTPTLVDQAAFSSLLDEELLPREKWAELVARLEARPTVARLVSEDGSEHAVELTEVSIERFVKRLNLDAGIPENLARLLDSMPPEEDRGLLKAVARRAGFRGAGPSEILFRFVLKVTSDHEYQLEEVLLLLELMETYKPADAGDLVSRIPHWLEVLENEATAAGQPKPFFAERVQEMHGFGRDQRKTDLSLIERKKRNMRFLKRLEGILGAPVEG